MAVLSLNESNFNETIKNSAIPVLVDFYADWCQPCKRIAPYLEEIAAENNGSILVCKVNVDQNQSLAAAHSVMSIPFVMCFKNGKVHKQSVGAVPKSELLALAD
jgi:thioredoxin 1